MQLKNTSKIISLLVLCSCILGCSKKSEKEVKNQIPQRIVTLSPVGAEIMFAVGAGNQVVAVSEFTDYPPEAVKLPVVGGFDGKTLSLETILSYKPDLIYMTDGMHNFMIAQLESYGVKYFLSKADGVEEVMQEILEIAEITGHAENGKKVVSQMKEKIGNIPEKSKVNVYWEVWNAPYMSAGSASFINDVIKFAGGKNIFEDIQESYPIVSEETIIKRAPDVILIPVSSGVNAETVGERSGWQDLPAVTNNRIFVVDDNLYTRAGPRIADVIVNLRESL